MFRQLVMNFADFQQNNSVFIERNHAFENIIYKEN